MRAERRASPTRLRDSRMRSIRESRWCGGCRGAAPQHRGIRRPALR